MKYILLNRGITVEIIPELDPIFPDVPIHQRYSAEFLDKCVSVEDDVNVTTGMQYDYDNQTFGTVVTSSKLLDMMLDQEYRISLLELGGI